jgi:hypothetical protein
VGDVLSPEELANFMASADVNNDNVVRMKDLEQMLSLNYKK